MDREMDAKDLVGKANRKKTLLGEDGKIILKRIS
jgi:hypothetical protein